MIRGISFPEEWSVKLFELNLFERCYDQKNLYMGDII